MGYMCQKSCCIMCTGRAHATVVKDCCYVCDNFLWTESEALQLSGKKCHFVSHKLPKLQISRLVPASLNKFPCFVRLSTLVNHCAVPPRPRWRAPPAVSSHLHSTLLKAEAALFLPPPPFLLNKPRIALRIFILTVFSAQWKKTGGKKKGGGGRRKRPNDREINGRVDYPLWMTTSVLPSIPIIFNSLCWFSAKCIVFFFFFFPWMSRDTLQRWQCSFLYSNCAHCVAGRCSSSSNSSIKDWWEKKKKKTSQERLAFVRWIQVRIKRVMNLANMAKKVSHTGAAST